MTEKLKKIIAVLFVSLLFYFITPFLVSAFECETITIIPIGDSGLNYTFTATNCTATPGENMGPFMAEYITEEGSLIRSPLIPIALPAGSISGPISFEQNGAFEVRLINMGVIEEDPDTGEFEQQVSGRTTIEITQGSDDPPGPDSQLSCGSSCNQTGVVNNCERCPSFCEAERVGVGIGFYFCGNESPLCNNNRFAEPGINSAIGCIPIENTTNTTLFLLESALALGGGITLLLLIIGAYKVIYSRGDPDALQGGRDIISAAVAGLILLTLSAFFVRIVLFDILQLL